MFGSTTVQAEGDPAAAGAAPAAGSWLCESAADRERMLDMESRIRPVRMITTAALVVALAACGPWLGWWTLPVCGVAAAGFVVADHVRDRMRYPEYAIMAAWCVSQGAIGAGAAVTGGPTSPLLALLALLIVSLSARFSLRGVVAGVLFTLAVIAAATAAVDAQALVDNPTYTILTVVLVVCVGALSTASMRSDVQHRSEAVLDQLTGMLNRTALVRRTTELRQQSQLVDQPVGLIVGDIDRFKAVNDTHGHAVGDAVLVDIAYLLRKQLRAFDLAYRIGGEEFLMLLPGADLKQAADVAERLRRTIADSTVAGGLEITMSFGVSGSGAGQVFDYEQVFAEADAALLAAKQNGRNQVHDPSGAAHTPSIA